MQALASTTTSGYIRVDGKPAKQALSTWVSKWVYLYTSHLQSKVGMLLSGACIAWHSCRLATVYSQLSSCHDDLGLSSMRCAGGGHAGGAVQVHSRQLFHSGHVH